MLLYSKKICHSQKLSNYLDLRINSKMSVCNDLIVTYSQNYLPLVGKFFYHNKNNIILILYF